MTTVSAPLQLQQQWATAVQQFVTATFAKYPALPDSFIPVLIEELKAMGLYREHISYKALSAAFNNAVAEGRIKLPVTDPVLTAETLAKIKNSFPPVVKYVEKQMSQRERNAMSGIEPQTARVSHKQQMAENNKAIEDKYAQERAARNAKSLRAEFNRALNDAEMLTGRTHSESASLRKEAREKVLRDPKFKNVRAS